MYKIGELEKQAVAEVIDSGALFRYSGSREGHLGQVESFEQEWSEYIGTPHTICTTSGTAALICALVGYGIGPGDEVIVPGYTYIATPLAVLNVGAIPVIVDVDESCTIDPRSVEKHISSRTKAIIPVHMQGMPCNLQELKRIAEEKQLHLIEDACQADGGRYQGQFLGTHGDAAAFSFNYFKIISAGESGAVVMKDDNAYQRAFIQHDCGCDLWPFASPVESAKFAGMNYRSNEINAAILRAQLQRLPGIVERLNAIKQQIARGFAENEIAKIGTSHDMDGDCGVVTLITASTQEHMRSLLQELVDQKIPATTPWESGRHVYCNWEVIMNKQGAHHPAMNPYNMDANRECQMDMHPDMLPQTLDVLKRSIMIAHQLDWTDDEVDTITSTLNASVEKLASPALV